MDFKQFTTKSQEAIQKAAELALHQLGITFSVYGDKKGTEKIFPFDVTPNVFFTPKVLRILRAT